MPIYSSPQSPPTATAVSPGAMPAADYAGSRFTGTAGAGNLTANKVCYYASGSSTLLHAQANDVATARNVKGVTTAAVTAAASAELVRTGAARITVAGDCVPAVGAKLYLSAATAGTVTTVLTASMYPVYVGECLSAAADANSTILVALDLSDHRDDITEWPLADNTLIATATTVAFTVTRALWRELCCQGTKMGPSDAAHYLGVLDTTSANNWYSTTITLTAAGINNSSTLLILGKVSGANAGGCDFTATEKWMVGTEWAGVMEATTLMYDSTSEKFHSRMVYRGGGADRFNFDGAGATVFQVGTRLVYTGKRRLA